MQKNTLIALGALLSLVLVGVSWKLMEGTSAAPPVDVAAQGPEESPSAGVGPEVRTGEHDLERIELGAEAKGGESTSESPPQEEGPRSLNSILNVHVKWRDGTLAEGVALLLTSRDLARHGHGDRWEVTSAEGVARFEGRFHGKCTVEADRGGRVSVEVIAGEENTVELLLGESVDVHGVVLGPDGRTIPGATIMAVSGKRDWRGTRPVATTDADGVFEIRCVDGQRSLGAFASGWAPSPLFDLSSVDVAALNLATGPLVEVVLELRDPGADIEGRVTDPEGHPIEGALVGVGTFRGFDDWLSNGHSRERPKPHVVETDADGIYTLKGVAAGTRVFTAWHRDWPIWREEIEVVAPGSQRLDIELSAVVHVYGTVRHPDGSPAAHAIVMALPEPFEDPYSDQGPTDSGSPFPHPRTLAGADGAFELGPLPLGTLHLYASLGTSYLTEWTGEEPTYEGMAQETLLATTSERIEWNPTLSFGFAISGHALFDDGQPIEDAFVSATDGEGGHTAVTTDTEGAFHLSGLNPVTYRIALQLPHDAPREAGSAALYDVVPPATGLELRADYSPVEPQPYGTVSLRMTDEASVGASLGRGAVLPKVYDVSGRSWAPMDSVGDLRFERSLSPGNYSILFMVEMSVVQLGPSFEIRSEEITDLGTLRLRALGSARLSVERPPGHVAALRVSATVPGYMDAPSVDLGPEESVAVLPEVAPGTVEFRVSGKGVADELVVLDIESGQEARAVLSLRPAVEVAIESVLARPQGFRRLTVDVTDSSGKQFLQRARLEQHIDAWPFVSQVSLPVGTYRIELQTSDGQRATEDVVIESIEPHAPVRITAR